MGDGLEGEFSDRLWLESSLGQTEQLWESRKLLVQLIIFSSTVTDSQQDCHKNIDDGKEMTAEEITQTFYIFLVKYNSISGECRITNYI